MTARTDADTHGDDDDNDDGDASNVKRTEKTRGLLNLLEYCGATDSSNQS